MRLRYGSRLGIVSSRQSTTAELGLVDVLLEWTGYPSPPPTVSLRICSRFASPKRILLREIGLVEAFRIGLEASRIELGAKRDRIVCDPFFDHALRVDEPSIEPLSEANVPSGFFATFGRPGLAHDVDEQARAFEVCIAGCVDERQMKLPTTLGYIPSDERRDEQRRASICQKSTSKMVGLPPPPNHPQSPDFTRLLSLIPLHLSEIPAGPLKPTC